jgi:DNA recombination protein RmuC
MELLLTGPQIPLLAALITGLLLGAITTWIALRGLIAAAVNQAKAESQTENALLNERLSAEQEETARLALAFREAERQVDDWRSQLEEVRADLREKLGAADATILNQTELLSQLRKEKADISTQREQLIVEQLKLTSELAQLSSTLEAERKQSAEKLQILNDAKEQLSNQFKSLAGEILEEKAKRFTEQNQTNIGALLEPLKTKLQEFQGKVEEVYIQEGKDRSALTEQVKQLMGLNQQLSQDAHNLTRALKGQSKAQGNWGELILERVLETSGLVKGLHYHAQESHTRDDGSRAQPDVVIRLPEGKHLVVDAKVSLLAYDEYVNADSDPEKDMAVKRHFESIRTHIKGLSSKNYQELYQLKSLDFVLMFVPVEPAFMLAISHDSEVWQEAWNKNVLLVSPSTLLFVVRTVAHLWRQEQQNRNAQEIAKRGAELYDKLVGFVEDLDKLGERLNQAKDSYDKAYGKFHSGKGNVIRQAEMLKELGIKPTKSLAQPLIELALEEDDAPSPKNIGAIG